MALTSPGVEVKVIDESFYTPAEPGTVPLIIVASAQDKLNGGGTGTAVGTLKANAGEVYLLTSQRDLVETFGDPVFKTDTNLNPIHAGEQNEYGLQAAYSLLGVSNRAFVVRADLDLSQLDAKAIPPGSEPENGTYWLDTQSTKFGIFEWNGKPVTTRGGQTFTNKVPLVITDSTLLDGTTSAPLGSVGSVGDYAVVHLANWNTRVFDNTIYYKNRDGDWVAVGSNAWKRSWPTVAGSKAPAAGVISGTFTFNVNEEEFTFTNATLADIADAITTRFIDTAISARVVNGKLEIYHDGTANNALDSSAGDSIDISSSEASSSNNTLVNNDLTKSILGIKPGSYYNPKLQISKHTQVPTFKTRGNLYPRPSGSVWIKSTAANFGAYWRVRRYNSETKAWEEIDSPIYGTNQAALADLDKVTGGLALPVGALYIQANYTEDTGSDETPRLANFKLFRRSAVNATTLRSGLITASTFSGGPSTYSFIMTESLTGTSILGDYNGTNTFSYKTITFSAGNSPANALTGTTDDAETIATTINRAGFTNITAEVVVVSDTQRRVVIKHLTGGDIRMKDGDGQILELLGYDQYNPVTGAGTRNLRYAPDQDPVFGPEYFYDEQTQDTTMTVRGFIGSLWEPLVYTASSDAPTFLAADGTLWYSSVIDEVDIMIHDGDRWVGYQSPTSPFYDADEDMRTDPLGPIVGATKPETQSDGTYLRTGDIWIDTSDIENFPTIYKYNEDLDNRPRKDRWVLVDKTDQSTEDGVIFADARYNTSGVNSYEQGSIVDLLTSDFVDTDTPDPALYPRGMLLWNLRRSGFNVKEFRQNYIDQTADNTRFGAAPTYRDEPMSDYYPHRWVTVSNNNEDGSGAFGHWAQRKVVVRALQALVNSNQQIRDEEARVFNLIACPGYPELIGEMISFNYDRGLTAFVVADTPARLTSDATSLLAWGTNTRLALEDNDKGAASYDEYMGMFYPWGFTSDNFGNNVVVPPSHMVLRTIALSDQVSYPWFAPAGLRRGGITNATAVGYVDPQEGEFKSVALNVGQRDTLYEAKINPITFFTGSGLVLWGQKTRAKAASALDRINVARLVIYLRRQLNALAKPYIFEPNDKITRDEVKAAVESLLLELVGLRALYDFLVVCDESNNTPSRIDRNELYIDIAIEPVKAVEFIYIPLRLKNTGEIKGLQ